MATITITVSDENALLMAKELSRKRTLSKVITAYLKSLKDSENTKAITVEASTLMM